MFPLRALTAPLPVMVAKLAEPAPRARCNLKSAQSSKVLPRIFTLGVNCGAEFAIQGMARPEGQKEKPGRESNAFLSASPQPLEML
jgi:hypothetical protein